jgi:hypothetical protein
MPKGHAACCISPAMTLLRRNSTALLAIEAAATAAEVQKIAEARLWTLSKTLGLLVEKAISAKVLKCPPFRTSSYASTRTRRTPHR